MYRICYLNTISPVGTALWSDEYILSELQHGCHAYIVRSAEMHHMEFPDELLVIARAGAGVNNIPIRRCSEKGIVVLNTPGANANAVVELTICGMLLGSRDILGGNRWVRSIKNEGNTAELVEQGKRRFTGHEIKGRSLGVIGLGTVGGLLANTAIILGMNVYGYDPFLSTALADRLSDQIIRVETKEEIFRYCDVVSLHTPLTDSTRNIIDADALAQMRKGVLILNFARDPLVDDDALALALKSGKVRCYITDFPNDKTADMDGVIAIPHLGASTEEAESDCAQMAVKQVMDYLENGNIIHSVNFPACDMGVCQYPARILIHHRNAPDLLNQFRAIIATEDINISAFINRGKDEYAYTMLDLDSVPSNKIIQHLRSVDDVLRVRLLTK